MSTRLWHLHNFASSELDRFRKGRAGAVALLALSGALLGVKIRLGALGGILTTARLVSDQLRSGPGLLR